MRGAALLHRIRAPKQCKRTPRCGAVLLALFVAILSFHPALGLRSSNAYWKLPQDRILLYWIDTPTFATAADVQMLHTNLKLAMEQWESICPACGIRFVEVVDRSDATFRVIGVNVQRAFIADGFNPSDPRDKWALKIDKSYFNPNSKFDKVGILRHELGHILGYRHEQIAAPADRFVACGWKSEKNTDSTSVISITDYDPHSLMQYPCGVPMGPVLFDFSPTDVIGHRRLYGPSPAIPPAVNNAP